MYRILAGSRQPLAYSRFRSSRLLRAPINPQRRTKLPRTPGTSTKKAAAAKSTTKKTAVANTTKKAANKGSMKRQAHLTKKKRLAMQGHKMRHATAKRDKRFAKSHGGRRGQVYGISTAKRMHRASAKSRTTNARAAISDRQNSIQRTAAYRAELAPTQRSCGEFMYRKDGKCNDARNKPPAK